MTDFKKAEMLVKFNKIEEVSEWIKYSNAKNKKLSKLLLMASYPNKASVGMVEMLLKSGANPNYETVYKEAPVSLCANYGDFASVKILL